MSNAYVDWCWTTFVFMSMLKSHCLLPKIAMGFFYHHHHHHHTLSTGIRVSRAGSQLKNRKYFMNLCHLPGLGHDWVLHSWNEESGQTSPPLFAAGLVLVQVLDLTPPPHVWLHLLQSLQKLTKSTGIAHLIFRRYDLFVTSEPRLIYLLWLL